MSNRSTKKELSGAMQSKNDREFAALLSVAERLKNAELPHISDTTLKRIQAIPHTSQPLPMRITVWSLTGSMAAFIILVIAAQFTSPGSPLYALKQGTDTIRAFVQPGYKDTLVDIHKDELKKLESSNASPEAIMEAEDLYLKSLENASEGKRQSESHSTDAPKPRSTSEDARRRSTETNIRRSSSGDQTKTEAPSSDRERSSGDSRLYPYNDGENPWSYRYNSDRR